MTVPRYQFRRTIGRRAFTLVELSIAIGITALVMGGICALTFAASVQWRSAEKAQSLAVTITQADARIEQIIRQAKMTGLVRTGGSISSQSIKTACVMFWREDTNGDKAMEFSEMGLLEYDKTAKVIWLYSVQWPSTWTAAQRLSADAIMSSSDLSSTTAPEDFKALAHVVPTTLVKNVTAASFGVASAGSTTERPKLDVVLQLTVGNTVRLRYFSAALRAPNKSPSAVPIT